LRLHRDAMRGVALNVGGKSFSYFPTQHSHSHHTERRGLLGGTWRRRSKPAGQRAAPKKVYMNYDQRPVDRRPIRYLAMTCAC